MYVKCDTVNNQIRTKSLLHEMKHHYSEDNRNNNLHHLKIPTILNYHPRTQTTRQHRGLVNCVCIEEILQKRETQGSTRFTVFPLLETFIYSVSLVYIQCLSGIRFWKNSLEQVSVERKVTQIRYAYLRRNIV